MSSSDRNPLQGATALAWSLLLIAALFWAAVWLLSQIWGWLLALALLAAATWTARWWIRRDRW